MSKRCTYCGWINSDDADTCKGCGYRLNKYWDYSGGKTGFVDTKKRR